MSLPSHTEMYPYCIMLCESLPWSQLQLSVVSVIINRNAIGEIKFNFLVLLMDIFIIFFISSSFSVCFNLRVYIYSYTLTDHNKKYSINLLLFFFFFVIKYTLSSIFFALYVDFLMNCLSNISLILPPFREIFTLKVPKNIIFLWIPLNEIVQWIFIFLSNHHFYVSLFYASNSIDWMLNLIQSYSNMTYVDD